MNQNKISYEKLLEIIALQTEVVQQGTDLGSIMDLVITRAQRITNADGACLELIEKNELVYGAVSGIADKFLGLRLNIENSLSGEAIKKKEILVSNDIEIDDRVNKEACRKIGIKAMIVVPLIFNENVIGVLKVSSTNVNHFFEEYIKILSIISDVIAAAIFSAMKNEGSELWHKATRDFLTGVPNRSLFYDRLRQRMFKAKSRNEKFAIIMIDMDNLKQVNDTYGHRSGDAALKEVAIRVKNIMSCSETFARLGGDEFGIISTCAKDKESVETLIEKLYAAIEQPFIFENHPIDLRVSAGYAIYGLDSIDMEDLIDIADKLMYEVKKQRKSLGAVKR